ncbi:MAG: FecR domain-containing protein [Bacteroidota bacterium]
MEITEELLRKYAKGECTEAECEVVEKWLASEEVIEDYLYKSIFLPEQEAALKQLHNRLWGQESLSLQSPEENLKKEKPRPTEQPIGSKVSHLPTGFKIGEHVAKPQRTRFIRNIMRYAAAVVMLFAVGFSAYHFRDGFVDADPTLAVETYKSVKTNRGEKRTVTLSDGSTVRMNYETEIRVPEKFEGNERVVYLSGHAHFDVARDTEHPFIIYTEDSKTQVLGTSFDINTNEEGETEIIVTSGKVAFSEKAKKENQVTLTVNDRAVLSAEGITKSEVDALQLTAWKDNRLVVDDQPLSAIIGVLEPWYDIEISVEKRSLLQERFTFSYDNPSLDMLMDRMSKMTGFNYKIKGKEVTLY